MLPARQQHRGLRLRLALSEAARRPQYISIPRQHYCLAMRANLGQYLLGRRQHKAARAPALASARAAVAGVAVRCSVGASARKVKIFLTSRVDTKGWLILLKLSRATCTGARAVGSNLRIGYDASLARPGDRCRFLRDGPAQVGPPSWSPPRRSLTSQLKKGKRRRRSPGGSIPCTPVHGGSQTDSGDTAFQPSP
jgi:hypothetical protein